MTANLTAPQYIYLVAVACYLLFFLLFLRLFWWKRYADTHFWRRRPDLSTEGLCERAAQAGEPLPRISILVPARNEADVIERTVEHMSTLAYPSDRYEVVVVTDEKEALAAQTDRERSVAEAVAALRGRSAALCRLAPDNPARNLILALLGNASLDGFEQVRRRLGDSEGLKILQTIPAPLLRPLIWEAADRLLQISRWRKMPPALMRLLSMRLPTAKPEEVQSAYAALLSLAIPTAVAYTKLRGGDGRDLGRRLAAIAAEAHHSLTREIILSMCDNLAADLIERTERLTHEESLPHRLAACYREIYPTTQDIMERKLQEMCSRTETPALKHVVVPRDFDGLLDGVCLGVTVPSTKGRALNYALSSLDRRTTWCGFFDAESRPDRRVMLYIAHRLLEARAAHLPDQRIFQGPVFQVRNWYEMGPFCKIASLYQAIAHDWYLPALFRRLPFVGGTNLFIQTALIREIGGYDSASLTEDLELGTRAYLKAGAWPEYLPYPSSEQTPPTFAGFYRQRLRWATGHLQVMSKVRGSSGYDETKKRRLLRTLWRKGQGEWLFYQSATMVPPLIVLLWFLDLVDPNVLGPGWHLAMNLLSTVYLGFTIYAFFRYLEHLDQGGRPRRWLGQLGAMAQLLVLPLAAFLFPVPYSSALVLSTLGRGPSQWVKTPRTRE
jgi:cellulose synthase/poly-beta-1,6-N-acetylglucosamine synthase-like glycosyltransferase